MAFFTELVILSFGILMLAKGSDWMTDSIVPLARRLGTSHTAVSLILVSIMVSLPEILVSIAATLLGHPVIGIGVIFGSIICNIGLMAGINAIRKPLHVERNIIIRDGVFSVVFAVVVLAVAADGIIMRVEGLALFLLFLPYIITVWEDEKLKPEAARQKDLDQSIIELNLIGMQMGKLRAGVFTFVIGTAVLLAGSQLFSSAMIDIAKISGISDLVIGVTLGAIGPSLPNILSAYKAGDRGYDGVVISETLGSNIFTLLVTLGVLSLLSPVMISPEWVLFDIPAVVVMSFLFLWFLITKNSLDRREGWILLVCYALILGVQVGRAMLL